MKERSNTCKFYIEDVEIIYHKDAKRLNFYNIPDKVIFDGISDNGSYDGTYQIIRERNWLKIKGVLEQVMEKLI